MPKQDRLHIMKFWQIDKGTDVSGGEGTTKRMNLGEKGEGENMTGESMGVREGGEWNSMFQQCYRGLGYGLYMLTLDMEHV